MSLIRFGFDWIGALAASGDSPTITQLERISRPSFKSLVNQGYRGPFAAADARVIHNAGGFEAQELAFALASALSYLQTLEARGFTLDAARRVIISASPRIPISC